MQSGNMSVGGQLERLVVCCDILFGSPWSAIPLKCTVFLVKPDRREGDDVKVGA